MTSSEDNKALVRAAFEPWDQGDSAPFFDIIAEDVVWTVIGTTPVSGVYRSKRALVDRAFGPLLERLEGPLTTRLIDVAAEGAKVFLRFQSTGAARTGQQYNQVYCFAMVMREGRIVEIVAYLDTELLARIFSSPPGSPRGGRRRAPPRRPPPRQCPRRRPHKGSRCRASVR